MQFFKDDFSKNNDVMDLDQNYMSYEIVNDNPNSKTKSLYYELMVRNGMTAHQISNFGKKVDKKKKLYENPPEIKTCKNL